MRATDDNSAPITLNATQQEVDLGNNNREDTGNSIKQQTINSKTDTKFAFSC